jgi:hypothetical protein
VFHQPCRRWVHAHRSRLGSDICDERSIHRDLIDRDVAPTAPATPLPPRRWRYGGEPNSTHASL